MELSKFQRVIWSINGVLILLVFLFLAFMLIRETLGSFRSYEEPELIVGEKLEAARKKGLILQGLEYSNPEPIFGGDNFIVPIKVSTYETPKENLNLFDSDSRSKLRVDRNYSSTVNVVFLDKDLKTTGTLLTNKALIKRFEYPSIPLNPIRNDTPNFKFIVYEIAFEDTNKDGTLTDDDSSDLYYSDLDGKNLTKITSEVDVINFSIVNPENILIRYTDRTLESQEHKRHHLSLYSVKTNELKELSSFDSALDEIEKNLFK